MAKNRNKKKRTGTMPMDTNEPTVSDMAQAMDTSESGPSGAQKPASSMLIIKTNKGRPMKRSKNVRKKKALAKAISLNEKYVEKNMKKESKLSKTQSAKLLYD